MIECYYSNCINHYKDEPFCKLSECIASEVELKEYRVVRLEYLKKYDLLGELIGVEL